MISQTLDNLSVIITRPINQSSQLKQKIVAHGGKAILFPTLQISALNPKAWIHYLNKISEYDLVIFTSKNAVDQVASLISVKPKKIAAIGPATAAELERHGLEVDIIPYQEFTSEGLLEIPFFNDIANKKIMIFAGEGGLDYLETQLKNKHADVVKVAVYQRKCPKIKSEDAVKLTRHKPCVVVSTSCENLQNLLKIMRQNMLERWLFRAPVLVVSNRIKQFAIEQGFQNEYLIQAENASENAILQALINWYDKSK